ncbi:Nbl1-Borealin-N domain-containing protein [Mycena indigotica]|uniref:Nbl1-Borealin-N domain-containing protein n=1 Tax=Mycena indigotica TaxID=2126181 RepID=A0A8H6SIR3_9AGAR|nr:Nbl1-Borealin-N domain-containing protein [Mycena indigotica]KAF7299082.1 Nbl1-Borealin-N domain-containing protein [Mycena indigotica]
MSKTSQLKGVNYAVGSVRVVSRITWPISLVLTTTMFTESEKHHLTTNLNIEVQHRHTQLTSWLHDHLENFTLHQEGLVSRIPKQVRAMTLRDFQKYNGNMQNALRAVQRERLAAVGATEIDKSTRKRKWVASQETENEPPAASEKSSKTARVASPEKKKPVPPRIRVLSQTANKPRPFGSPSPQKSRAPFSTSTQSPRPMSPTKFKPTSSSSHTRVPSLATFNPAVPKTPGYPTGSLRLPRKHESMFSLNGSPIANPHDLEPVAAPTLKRTKSNITISRDPSFTQDARSRTTSQSSTTQHQSFSSSSSLDGGVALHPTHPSAPHERTKSEVKFKQFKFPQAPVAESVPITPAPRRPLHTRAQSTLPITLSTKDGHLLTFDALEASPGQLEALEGISNSAKKQAREEMRQLVRAAVDKWTV